MAHKVLGDAGHRGHQAVSAISLDSRTKAWAVAAKVEGKGPCDAITVAELVFSFPRDCLDPAECLPDPLANARVDGIAAVPGRSPVNRRSYGRWCSVQHAASRSIDRSSLTKSSASQALSTPGVIAVSRS